MGFMKRQQEEEAAQGWRSVGNKYVCGSCIEEESLAQLVQARADRHRCDYCGREDQGQPISARVDLLVGCIAESLATEYGDPNEELPFDSAEGGYQGDVLDLQNVLNQEDCA